jgi:hypothetical protein
MQSDYSSLAVRRYRKYRLERNKESFKRKVISFLFRLFQAIARTLQRARILGCKVETVAVEYSAKFVGDNLENEISIHAS